MEDATKALEATNGTTLEKNGQILRVAYAKSILGPGSGTSGSGQSSSLAAAAIEAATFAQQVLYIYICRCACLCVSSFFYSIYLFNHALSYVIL